MDILSVERVWEDNEFFEIKVSAQTKLINASVRSYTTDEWITGLAHRLATFPNGLSDRFIWENGEKGDETTPFVSLEVWCADKLGHVVVEVYMEIDDGALFSKHNCCFYVRTEIGMLNRFGKDLFSLVIKGVGHSATLNKLDY